MIVTKDTHSPKYMASYKGILVVGNTHLEAIDRLFKAVIRASI